MEDDDSGESVEPVLRREAAENRKVRLLYLPGPEAREVEGDAMKSTWASGCVTPRRFERVAVVSDEDWMRPALRALSFLMPGQAKGFRVHELEQAKQWLSEGDGVSSPT